MLRAPSSGRPFENLTAGILLVRGFIVDVDLLWSPIGEGNIAQFDLVASAVTGQRALRMIVECKGGDKWAMAMRFNFLASYV